MTSAQIYAAYLQVQAALESAYPGTLTIGGQAYACTRGNWRADARLDERSATMLEVRTCAVRIRKSLLENDGITITPQTTTCQLDATACHVTDIKSGPSDNAYHLTLEAAAPTAPQS